MSKVSFTICSNNYLAQAKALGDSLLVHNSDYTFIICLVDRLSDQVDYTFFTPHEIICIEDVPIANFEEMIQKYDIVELNTAVKPFIFKFLFDRSKDISNVIYLDPDIIVYDTFDEIHKGYNENTFVLTPHFTTPINDNFLLKEEDILNCGLYNLGFLGLKYSNTTFRFLDWWMTRLKDRCLINMARGLFVDQLWINFVPLYYDGVFIMRHLGYNMAYWNLHERKLQQNNESYMVNEQYPLVFYHFSGYNVFRPTDISKYQTRFTFELRPELIPLFEDYKHSILQNNHANLSTVPCYFIELQNQAKIAATAQAEEERIRYMKQHKKMFFKIKMKAKLRHLLHLNN